MAKTFGQGGTVEIGPINAVNYTVCVTEWAVTEDFGTQVLTTTCSDGFQELGTGIKSLEVTFGSFYDPTATPFVWLDNSSSINMLFNLGDSGSTIEGSFFVKNSKITNPATEYIKLEMTVGSTGNYTYTT